MIYIIMILLVIIINFIILNKTNEKKLLNPSLVFSIIWLLISFFSILQWYGLYEASTEAYIIIFFGVACFSIGYFLSNKIFKEKVINKANQKNKKFLINYKLVIIIEILCIAYFSIGFIKSIWLLLNGESFNSIRSIAQTSIEGSKLNNVIYNFFILPAVYAIEALAVVDYWCGNKNKKLFILNIVIIIMRVIVDGGRTPLINFIIYMAITYLLININKPLRKILNFKKNKKLLISLGVCIILLLIVTFSRIENSVFRITYFYFTMSPVLLSKWVEYVNTNNIITYGITSLNGIFFTINYFIKNVFGLPEYIKIIKDSYDLIAITDSNWQLIAQGSIKANAYVSAFLFFYADGKLLGVGIWSIIFGLISGLSYNFTIKKQNIKNFSVVLLIFQGIVYSFIRFYFIKPYYILALLFILTIAFKKKKYGKKGINYEENSTIYVVCPAFNKTGGTELMHQFVYQCNRMGINSIITYYGKTDDGILLNPAFQQYVDKYTTIDKIQDDEKNIIILPEIEIQLAKKYKNIQKCIWWMSVDNYLKRNGIINSIKYYGFLRSIKFVLNGSVKIFENNLDNTILHLYQSEYAKNFLEKHNIDNMHELSDYINDAYFKQNESEKRENVVLYNPKKGYKFTKKIIENAPDIKWKPIENMTTEEVINFLRKSKVYIDFGNHPGKDRFPREAAISGCCIIMGKKGAANFYEDISIDDEFKFKDKNKNIPEIIQKIKSCINNYENEAQKFNKYKEKIKNEKEAFIKNIEKIFKI